MISAADRRNAYFKATDARWACDRIEALERSLRQTAHALEHAINRPHEHNPLPAFTSVACEILTDARDVANAALGDG